MSGKDWIRLGLMLAMLVLAVALFSRVDTAQEQAETELVRQAVKSAALTCYAVEGAYPVDASGDMWGEPSGTALQYLRDNYHLAYDEDRYLVTYQAFASNMMPDIRVIERGTGL